MQRRWVIVAFGDILGFGTWRRRASTTPEIAEPFIQSFYDEMESFVLSYPNIHFKYLGDGFMAIRELPKTGQVEDVKRFIDKISKFTKRMEKVVKNCDWPPPDGFRTRVVIGHVSKLEVVDPNDQKKKIPEYIGYAVNLAQRLLEIAPRTSLILHQSVIKVIGNTGSSNRLKKLNGPPDRRGGVDQEDLAVLWTSE